MPQKAVAPAGQHEGHAGLAVAVGQLQGAALPVQDLLLILAHAVQALALLAVEGGGQGEIAAQVGLKFSGSQRQGVGRGGLPQQQLAPLVVEGDSGIAVPAVHLHPRGQPAAADLGPFILDGNGNVVAVGGLQKGEAGVGHIALQRRAHPQAVLAPGADDQRLAAVAPDQGAAGLFKVSHRAPSLYVLGGKRSSSVLSPSGRKILPGHRCEKCEGRSAIQAASDRVRRRRPSSFRRRS